MDRRSLLIGLMAILATPMTACQGGSDNTLSLAAIAGVLSPQMLRDIKQNRLSDAIALRLKTQESLVALFQQLQGWQEAAQSATTGNQPRGADWALLSDYWLWPAIQQGLIRPLDNADALTGWESLPDIWPRLLQRNQQGLLSETGPIWGTPYRWNHLMVVYDRRFFQSLGWEPTTWSDLLRPELQARIILPDHPRLVLGLLLKAFNYSVNEPDPASHADVVSALETLRPQVKAYDSTTYLQSLVIGDVPLAVGWSGDIQPLLSRYRYLQAVAPDPGTLLSADVWTKPNLQATTPDVTPLSDVDQAWLSYWWQPEVVTSLSLLAQGLSPLLLADQPVDFDFELAANTVMPAPQQLQSSEFVEPLEEAAIANYNQLWQQLRGRE
jgi:putative spermidine/putrescine transport system substrate-binding protein